MSTQPTSSRAWRRPSSVVAVVTLFATAASATAQIFDSGIAVGDVTDTSAVFWTRATGAGGVSLELATNADFTTVLRSVPVTATADTDFCAKADVSGLTAGTRYYYRFLAGPPAGVPGSVATSAVGTFATFPAPTDAAPVRFLFTGDSNAEFLPFVAFDAAARENADLFIWFGDTIYGDVTAGGLGPAKTLDDYRAKYAQVHADAGVQATLAAFPIIVGADDHEVYNDYAGRDPSVPADQIESGYRAFFEWMPIRDPGVASDPRRQYRSFRYGANAEFFVLDGRQYRETSALAACGGALDPDGFLLGPIGKDGACIDKLNDPRSMLGQDQLNWLKDVLRASTAKVKFVVNNVPMSYLGIFPYDRWDGYDAERRDLLHFIDANAITGVVILTTDIHANGYNPDVTRFFRENRPAYGLRGRVAIPEVIAGPIGNETARQSVDDVVEALVGGNAGGPLANFGEGVFIDRLKSADGFTFVDANQRSYVVIEVTSTGEVQFSYRGLTPERIAAGATDALEFASGNIATVAPPMCGPCGLPVALLVVGLAGACFIRRRPSHP